MATFQSIEEARAFFAGDRFAVDNGMRIDEIGDGSSVCSLELGEGHQNANHSVMGGVIFTLADFAFAVAANNRHFPTVTQQVSISFLNAAKGDRLIARALCKKDGKNSCVYSIDVTDDLGCEVAQFVGIGAKLAQGGKP